MKHEELLDDVKDFSGFLDMYRDLIKTYHETGKRTGGSGSVYSEGVTDALISVSTLYKVIFKRALEEEKEN